MGLELTEVSGWVSAPQAHSRVSNINFDIWFFLWKGVSINILCKIYQGRQSSCPFGVSVKGIDRAFNRLKCLGGFVHLKPTAGCQILTLIFELCFVEGVSINILWKIYQGRQSSCPLGIALKDIARVYDWFKCLGGFSYRKPTVWCQISTLIFKKNLWRGISMNIP
jgi:hypothetical protein